MIIESVGVSLHCWCSKSLAVFHAEVSDGSVLRMKCPPDTQVFIQKPEPFLSRFYQVVLQQVAYGSVRNISQSCTVHEAVRTVVLRSQYVVRYFTHC